MDELTLPSVARTRLRTVKNEQESPEQASRVLSLQTRTGLPEDMIRRNLDFVEKEASKAGFNADEFRKTSPVFADWVARNPSYLDAVRDDMDDLSGIEWAAKAMSSAWKEGWATVEMGRLGSQMREDGVTEEREARLKELEAMVSGGHLGAESPLGKLHVGTFRQLPIMFEMMMRGSEMGLGTGMGLAGMAATLGQLGPQVGTPEELVTVPAAFATGFGVGSAAGAGIAMAELEGGLAYLELREIRDDEGNPLPEDIIRQSSRVVGLINAGLESFGLGKTLKYIPGVDRVANSWGMKAVKKTLEDTTFRKALTNFAKRYGETLSSEVITEIMQESSTILAGEISKAIADGNYEGMTAEQIGERLADIAVETLYGAGIVTAVGPTAQFVSDANRARTATQQKAVFEALGEHAANSKTAKRVPEKFKEFVEAVRDSGEVKDIGVPVEAFTEYFQSKGMDPEQVAQEVTGSTSAYQEAVAAGTDIKIPLQEYTANLAGTDHHQGLLPHLRLHDDEMTLREAETWRANRDKIMEDLRSGVPEDQQSAPEIFEKTRSQLIEAGTDPVTAENQAKLMEAVFTNMAFMANRDPMELYNERFSGVSRPRDVSTVDRSFEQVVSMQGPALERIRVQRTELDQQREQVAGALNQINLLADRFTRLGVDIADDEQMLRQIEVDMFRGDMERDVSFQIADRRTDAKAPTYPMVATGKKASPRQLLSEFRALEEQHETLRQQLRELEVQEEALDRQVDTIFSGVRITDRELGQSFDQLAINRPADFFDKEAIDHAFRAASGSSRSAIVSMTPNQFLDMAAELTVGPSEVKLLRLEMAIDKDMAMDEVPFLFISLDKNEDGQLRAKVEGHEGRHRMTTLVKRGLGDRPVPVRIVSQEIGDEPAIRWNTDDRRPDIMVAEDAHRRKRENPMMPFPQVITREQFDVMFNERLRGAPFELNIEGLGLREFGVHEPAQAAARRYTQQAGIDYNEEAVYASLDVARAEKIAREFELMEHDPQNPEVLAAYDAMIAETIEQYKVILETGLEIEFIDGPDPYVGNPRKAILDVIENNHLWVFSTRDGFGSDETFDAEMNPLLRDTEFEISGKPALANDIFRVVHDYFGHIKNGVGFRARGEENAWQSHASMYSPLARRAMTVETRGQNSWVNFGPHAEHNRTASAADTVYADQKIGLLPLWVSEEGRQSAERPTTRTADASSGTIDRPLTAPPVREDGRIELTHFSGREGLTRIDPAFEGTGADATPGGKRRAGQRPRQRVARSYYGISPGIPGGYRREALVGGNQYTTSIDPSLIYDLAEDPLDLRQDTIEETEIAIREAGFVAWWHNHPQIGLVAIAFDPLQVESTSKEFNQSAARNSMGLYSAVEKAVWDMKLSGWDKKAPEFTDADQRRMDELEQALDLRRYNATRELVALTEKKRLSGGTVPMSGNTIWQKLQKMPGVKQEEIYWLGIEEFLTTPRPGEKKAPKLTRAEVANFIRNNGVEVEESVGETEGEGVESIEWSEEVLDDASFWEHRVEDYMYDFDRTDFVQGNNDTYVPFDIWDWLDESDHWEQLLEKLGIEDRRIAGQEEMFTGGDADPGQEGDYETLLLLAIEHEHMLFVDVEQEVRDLIRDDFEEAATEAAEQEYMDNPVIRYTASNIETDVDIEGNEDYGYRVYGSDREIYDLDEAKIEAEQLARERGELVDEGSEDAAVVRQYFHDEPGPRYREVKLKLPQIDSNVSTHFPNDDSVVASVIVWNNLKTPESGLHIAETQSDWHTEGRVSGYKLSEKEFDKVQEEVLAIRVKMMNALDNAGLTYEESQKVINWVIRAIDPGNLGEDIVAEKYLNKSDITRLRKLIKLSEASTTDAPFKGNNWLNLVLKRMLIIAAEEGYEYFSWSDAQTVNKRWSDNYDYRPQYDQKMVSMVKKLTGQKPEHFDSDGSKMVDIDEQSLIEKAKKDFEQLGVFTFPDGYFLAISAVEGVDLFTPRQSHVTGYLDIDDALNQQRDRLIERRSGYWAIPITDELRERVKTEGFSLFQEGKSPRGKITFDATNKASIQLMRSADASTFLHESGHLWLEMLGDLAEVPGAEKRLTKLYADALNWLGVENRSQITTDHHEKFARAFEAYLREGRAPTPELQGVFASFRAWLMNIYRKVRDLDVQLNYDIRSVFDRLIAGDDAIAAAEQMRGYVQLFATAEEAGMSEQMFSAYRQTMSKAHAEAEEEMTRRLMNAAQRESRRWYREERKRVREEVAERVQGMRGYRALSILSMGREPDGADAEIPFKLDKDDLVRRRGKDFLKELPRPYVYTVEGGTDADVVALALGYGSGNELLDDLVRLKAAPMRETIEIETDRAMAERYPDPALDGSLGAIALDVIHNDKHADLLAAELRALRRKQREVRPFLRAQESAERRSRAAGQATLPGRDDLAILKASAREFIGNKRVRDVSPNTYRVAEAKASREAFNAAAKKDYETAYEAKRREILNHELYRAAVKAREESDRARKFLRKFDRKPVRERIGKAGGGLLEHIDSILDSIDLRQISGAQIDRETARAELRRAFDEGLIVADPAIMARLGSDRGQNWQMLTVDELLGIRDVVRQIETLARREAAAIINGERVMIQERADEVVASVMAANEQKPTPRGDPTFGERMVGAKREALSLLLRPSSIARVLDESDFGAITRNFILPIRRAYAERLIPMEERAREAVTKLYRKHYSNKELSAFNKRDGADGLNDDLSKSDRLSLALNWGNEENRAAVLGGVLDTGEQAFPEDGVMAALSTLDSRDWAFVQDVWDYLDSYWPELQRAERLRRGVAPKKVEASSFSITTADGQEITVRGGYYPLKYNPELSDRQKRDDIEDFWKKVGHGGYVTANTRAGATHERVQNHKRVVRLGLGVIDQHLREVIRDVAIGDEVNFVAKLLNHGDIKRAFRLTGNSKNLQALQMWIQDAAAGELPADGIIEKASAYTRVGFTKAKLAFNALVTLLQWTGFAQTAAVMGTKATAYGVSSYASNPASSHRWIMQNSAFMTARYGTNSWNKDVADTRRFLTGATPFGKFIKTREILDRISAAYFWPIAKFQMVVDEVTWLGGYWKAQNERGLTGQAAIDYADATVERAQTSGFFSDRSGVERGSIGFRRTRQSQFVRLWTTLASYMMAKNSIAYEKARSFGRKPSVGGAVFLATDMLLLYTVEAMLAGVIYGRWPDEDDEESVAGWIAQESVSSVASGIPFVREIGSARFGGGTTPLGAVGVDIYRAMFQVQQAVTEEDQVDLTLLKSLNNVGGTLFHYPSSQTNRAIDAMWRDNVEGEDVEVYEYLTGKRDR